MAWADTRRLHVRLLMQGALGNVIDRVRWGAVADFIDFHVAGWHFWAFNLADTWISSVPWISVFTAFIVPD